MRILSIDTSARSCSAAVMDSSGLLAEITTVTGHTHSRQVMAMIHSVLELSGMGISRIDGFAFTKGPGSFTGLRIGISTILGLAAATRKPIVGVSGLDALALQSAAPDIAICPLIDAGKNEVYCARYRWDHGGLIRESSERSVSPAEAIENIHAPVLLTGSGAQRYRSLIQEQLGSLARFAPDDQGILKSATIARISLKRFETHDVDDMFRMEPLYIRKPDAKIQVPLFSLPPVQNI